MICSGWRCVSFAGSLPALPRFLGARRPEPRKAGCHLPWLSVSAGNKSVIDQIETNEPFLAERIRIYI